MNLTDLVPKFFEAVGVTVPDAMTGESLVDLLKDSATDAVEVGHERVVFGRERHTPAHEALNMGGYPARALRTDHYLYIRNYYPERWPVGTPRYEQAALNEGWISDTDNGPAKFYLWTHRDAGSRAQQLYELSFGKRPAIELYDLRTDPHQLHNVAFAPDYARGTKAASRTFAGDTASTRRSSSDRRGARAGSAPISWGNSVVAGIGNARTVEVGARIGLDTSAITPYASESDEP